MSKNDNDSEEKKSNTTMTVVGILVLLLMVLLMAFVLYAQYLNSQENYRVVVGNESYYCDSYRYADNGSLVLYDCRGYTDDVTIQRPANVQIIDLRDVRKINDTDDTEEPTIYGQ